MFRIKKFLYCILHKFREHRFVRKMSLKGMELCLPYYGNPTNIKFTAPVYIGPEAWFSLRGRLYIGSGTIIGPRLKVHTSNHRWQGTMLPYDDVYEIKDVVIGENVWIGADVTLLPGVEIGNGAVVAACSCVTKNVPPMALVGGNPAKVIKYRDESVYEHLKESKQIYLDLKRLGKTKKGENRYLYVKSKTNNLV